MIETKILRKARHVKRATENMQNIEL